MGSVAFLGLGVMGFPMAGHLKNKGGNLHLRWAQDRYQRPGHRCRRRADPRLVCGGRTGRRHFLFQLSGRHWPDELGPSSAGSLARRLGSEQRRSGEAQKPRSTDNFALTAYG